MKVMRSCRLRASKAPPAGCTSRCTAASKTPAPSDGFSSSRPGITPGPTLTASSCSTRRASPFLPFNPNACWDWWSYIDHDDGYVTKAGLQIAAIKSMLDALTAGGGARPPTLPGQTGVPAEMIVTDSSDTAAALAWTPVQGASSYRIWRPGADNVFRTVGETQGPSYGDHGLAPATPYAWQVTAVVGGIEQPPSPSTRASTRPTSPRCDTPGSCQ